MMEYKRLTERRGSLVIDNCKNCECVSSPQGCTDKQCYEMMKNRLAELEDKIEQGTLIELPVKLTHKCYVIFGRNEKYIKEVCVIMYEIGTVDQWARVIWYEGDRKLWEDFHVKELYATREEAEKRLKELQNG